MVAVIKTGHSVHRILNYNEHKVKQGVAVCIGASNYPVDAEQMSLSMKLNRLQKQLQLNENVTRGSVHISLNFDISESLLPDKKLYAIAETYMDKIGFGDQPFLVYRHNDAGHPHIHIVSVKVRADGSRIDMNNMGRNQSKQARKEIEKTFGLVAAEAQKKQEAYKLKPVSANKVLYGKSATKAAMQNVLEHVLNQYKYTSLPELNAVLKQYNVVAERGIDDSRVYKHNGLLYRVLDDNGRPVGVPIKASLFYNKPTLRFLEQKFTANEPLRVPHKSRVKNAIDVALLSRKLSLSGLVRALEKQGIATVVRQNDEGVIYGITYVDHQTRCVFNGSALGKPYSAKGVQERCLQNMAVAQPGTGIITQQRSSAAKQEPAVTPAANAGLLDELMQPEQVSAYTPHQLKKKRKKKKRNNLNNNQ